MPWESGPHPGTAMHVIVWAFEVRRGSAQEFEELYRSRGGWAGLFAMHPGYRGTELLRDTNRSARYLTIDRWESREAYDGFKERSRPEYDALNARGEALTKKERLIGRFDTPE